jgi:hypothetical protein
MYFWESNAEGVHVVSCYRKEQLRNNNRVKGTNNISYEYYKVDNEEEWLKKVMKNKLAVEREATGKSKRWDRVSQNGMYKTKKVQKEKELQVPVDRGKSEKMKQQGEERKGKCKVPEATDEHGCRHYRLLSPMALPKNYLEAYVKKEGWLYKMPCKACAAKSNEAT